MASEEVKYSGLFNIAGGQVVPQSSFANIADGINVADVRMSGYTCDIALNQVPACDMPDYFYIGVAQLIASPLPSVVLGNPKLSLQPLPSRAISGIVASPCR
jgi:hypothetical protein